MRKLKEMNEALPEILVGILLYGIVVFFIAVWFVANPLDFSMGLIVGVVAALIMAYNMAWSLNISCELDESSATKQMQKYSMLRYGMLICLLGIVLIIDFGDPVALVIGTLGLKVSAYISPFTHKLIRR